MASIPELARGMVAVLATVFVITGLIGLGTEIGDQTAVLRSLAATTVGLIVLALVLSADRRHRLTAALRHDDDGRSRPQVTRPEARQG